MENLPTEFDREPRRNDDRLMVKHIQIRAGKMVKQICLVLLFRLVGKQHPSMSKIPSSWWWPEESVWNPGGSPWRARYFVLRTARSVWLASSGYDSIHRTNHPPREKKWGGGERFLDEILRLWARQLNHQQSLESFFFPKRGMCVW